MNLAEFIRKVRSYTRYAETNANPDSAVIDAINDSYHQLMSDYTTKYPLSFIVVAQFPLTGVFTTLPNTIKATQIVRVELVTDTNNTANEHAELHWVSAKDMTNGPIGYTVVGDTIRLVGMTYETNNMRVYYRPPFDVLELNTDTTALIPTTYQDAVMWGACVLLQTRDMGPTPQIMLQAHNSRMRLFAGMQRPSNVFNN